MYPDFSKLESEMKFKFNISFSTYLHYCNSYTTYNKYINWLLSDNVLCSYGCNKPMYIILVCKLCYSHGVSKCLEITCIESVSQWNRLYAQGSRKQFMSGTVTVAIYVVVITYKHNAINCVGG